MVKGYYMHEGREIMRFWLEWMERRLCCLSWVKAVSLAALILSIWLGTSQGFGKFLLFAHCFMIIALFIEQCN